MEVNGRLFFDIPTNAKAQIYRLTGSSIGQSVQISATDTARELSKNAHIDSKAYGPRGIEKFLGRAGTGSVLAFGPQAYVDITESSSLDEFIERSAYNQPTNAAAFVAGVAVGSLVAGPGVIVLAVTLAAGAAVQFFLSDHGTGWANDVGDFLTGKD